MFDLAGQELDNWFKNDKFVFNGASIIVCVFDVTSFLKDNLNFIDNIINIFNPEVIVIGGGLSNISDMLLEPAYIEAERRAFKQSYRAVRFERAALGRNSGVIGAAIFAWNRMKGSDDLL